MWRSLLFILPLFSCGQVNGPSSDHVQKPNVVLILTDDQGWGDLSVSGNLNLHTPNIDALATQGATFSQFYVSPVCSPTRAEILTGRYHPRLGVHGTSRGSERLDLDEVTLADVLRESGYHTGAFGKWHNGMQYPYHPNGRGFDEFYGFCSGHWGDYFSPMLEHNGEIIKGEGFVIDDFTSKAISFIEEHQADPFFVYLPYNTPHRPMQVPDRWWNGFKDRNLDMRYRDPTQEDLLHTRAALAMCENIDWNVGRITHTLQELGLEENTIVIYLSDNGPNGWRWNGGMRGRKGSTDEGGVRSPMFMQWKGHIAPDLLIDKISASIDFLPTLLDLLDIDVALPHRLDGMSLEPILFETKEPWQDRTIFSHWNGRVSVRSQQYRLDHEDRLYDMAIDMGQDKDRSKSLSAVQKRLVDAKSVWVAEVLAELPDDEERPFILGHPDYDFFQIPARDGEGHGSIERSNRWPNCSYFTEWTALEDSITWDVEVMDAADFEVTLYYTCSKDNIGSTIQLACGHSSLTSQINIAHDPPLRGMEHDRHPRGNSFVKDWQKMSLGTIKLNVGRQSLILKSLDIPGTHVMDFRLLMFTRV